MEFNHLRSMAALFQPKTTQIDESYDKAFEDARREINSALSKLEGSLGKAGGLEVMMHRSGLAAKDKIPDENGHTILQSLQHKTKEYAKSVRSNLDELELMFAGLSEAHMHHDLTSGMHKTLAAKSKVDDVKNGHETVDVNGVEYKSEGKITGNKLAKGMTVMGSYLGSNQGAMFIEILGFTDNDTAYGDKPVFDSIEEVFKHHGVSSLKELNVMERQREYGYSTYMVCREIADGDEFTMYLYNGAWAVGSGADRVSFTKLSKV